MQLLFILPIYINVWYGQPSVGLLNNCIVIQHGMKFNYVAMLLVLFGGECARTRPPVVAFSCKTIAPRLDKRKT
jgi:hypothetical protein